MRRPPGACQPRASPEAASDLLDWRQRGRIDAFLDLRGRGRPGGRRRFQAHVHTIGIDSAAFTRVRDTDGLVGGHGLGEFSHRQIVEIATLADRAAGQRGHKIAAALVEDLGVGFSHDRVVGQNVVP